MSKIMNRISTYRLTVALAITVSLLVPAEAQAARKGTESTSAITPIAGPTDDCSGPVVPPGAFPNPLHNLSTGDPGMLRVATAEGQTWYAYSTSGTAQFEGAVVIRKSSDLRNWVEVGRMFMPGNLPLWAKSPGAYWAPQVYPIRGRYVAYFAAIAASDNKFKIGVATAPHPEGPWSPRGDPLVSRSGFGVIDPSMFRDPATGMRYLLWKNDTNDLDPPRRTRIRIQRLSADGLRLNRGGSLNVLTSGPQDWEGPLIESPSMEYFNGRYYLFYSANRFAEPSYAVGVARSAPATSVVDAVLSGFEKFNENPILRCNQGFNGPGGQDVVRGLGGKWLMFYHADPRRAPYDQDATRYLMMDEVRWRPDGWPQVNNGTPSG
jgi:beta-xylosidase